MKKIIAVLCLLSLCLPLCACASSLATEEVITETKEEIKTVEEKEEEKGDIVYPDSFAMGYAAGDITGSLPIPIFEDEGTSVADPLMLTCTAVWDGKTAALLMSADLRSMGESVAKSSGKMIEKQFGIPAENVIINCTHTHEAPHAGSGGDSGVRWLANYYKQLPIIVEKALRDLDVVEGIYTGKSYTEKLCFVRRYLMPDGTYRTNPGSTAVAHETEADPELNTLRIDRKNNKDILMVNYQTHYVGGIGEGKVSADFVGPFRAAAEKEFDCHFVYHQGGGANINFNSAIPGERIYFSHTEASKGFMITTRDALAKEEKVDTGKIISTSSLYPGKVGQDTPERIAQAQEIMSYPESSAEYLAALGKYGMEAREAEGINRRSKKGEIVDVNFTAISFGDIGFASAPYEMFDTNGKEVRDGSPFKMTFVLSYTNGGFGYVPSALAWPNKGYEVYITWFAQGSAEEFSGEMVRLLNLCNEAKN